MGYLIHENASLIQDFFYGMEKICNIAHILSCVQAGESAVDNDVKTQNLSVT